MGLIKFNAPALPIPTTNYSQDQQQQRDSALRLYFNQIDFAYWDGTKVVNPYGAWQSSVTQTATANTATVMSMNVTDYQNGISLVSSTKMTVATTGFYNLQFSAQFQNTTSALEDVSVWVRLNGTDVDGSTGLISIPNKHGGVDGHTVAGWNQLIQLTAKDYIELWWSTTNASVTLQYYGAGTSPTRPTTPSIAASLTYVSAVP
jgi:hypothetical protein